MIKIKEIEGKTIIKISEDWNWVVSKKLESMNISSKNLVIELAHCRLMDSEAIILLNKWIQEGITIELRQVPSIYFKILQILHLEDRFAAVRIQQ